MGLPQQIDPATPPGSQDISLGDDRIRELKRAINDIFGIPDATNVNNAVLEIVAAGLKTVLFSDAAANPTAIGTLRRNGSKILWHNGERAVELQPAGEIKAFGGSSAPAGWQICDGSAISRTTFARLFAAIGTTYGAGDGSTTFNVPNLKGKIPVGKDSGDTDFDTLGETGGAKSNSLPNHVHDMGAHVHGLGGTFTSSVESAISPQFNTGSGFFAAAINHTHNVTLIGVTGTPSVANTGNPTTTPAISVVQPYLVVDYYIST